MKNVEIYSSTMCSFCYRAKALLKQKDIPFREIGVDMNSDARSEMKNRSGGHTSVPQIFIDGDHVGGCDELYALDARGGL